MSTVAVIPHPVVLVEHDGSYRLGDESEIVWTMDAGIPAEGYVLDVDASGVRIAAADDAGRFYARQTLRQLVADLPGDVPFVHLEDHPRFEYRGAMLDVARHFFPVEVVLRHIDRIAALKLNHLHLHLTDDQGWRIEIPGWPELTRAGAASAVGGAPGGFYTREDYRRIVEHAAQRFVTVVPEIDMPGHTNAAAVAYPELDGTGKDIAPYHGIDVGFSTLRIGDAAVEHFVADVVREVTAITPGPYLHLGGDESLSTSDEDFLAFVKSAAAAGAATGKTVIGWHEMGRSRELPAGTVGQYWGFLEPRDRSGAHARSFVEQGGRLILSPADAIYVDHKYADDDPIGLVWADGPTTLRQSYDWDPAAILPDLPASAILGIEGALWTETVETEEQLEWLVFPRLVAVAELAWSPRETHDWEHFRQRLAVHGARMDAAGIRFFRAPEVDWA